MNHKRTVRYVSELPDWLDLKRYEVIKELNNLDLISQVDLRRRSFSYLKSKDMANVFSYGVDTLEEIKSDPIIKPETGSLISSLKSLVDDAEEELIKSLPDDYSYTSESAEDLGRGIAELLSLDHFLWMANDLQKKGMTKKQNDTHICLSKDHDFPPEIERKVKTVSHINLDEVLDESVGDAYQPAHVSINLAMPDKIILEHLKAYLPVIREKLEAEKTKPVSQNDFDKIRQYKIIPMIDLKLWAEMEGVKVPDRVVDKFLFPFEKGELAMKRTVRPFYEKVISDKFISECYIYLTNNRE